MKNNSFFLTRCTDQTVHFLIEIEWEANKVK